MTRVSAIDGTGTQLLGAVITKIECRGIIVLMSGIRPGHDEVLAAVGACDHLRANGRIFAETPDAIRCARRPVFADSPL